MMSTNSLFKEHALQLFHSQYSENEVYRSYCDLIKVNAPGVTQLHDIPFLPISFFKSHRVISGRVPDDCLYFESSGTTGDVSSRHFVPHPGLYTQNLLAGFRAFYGDPADYIFLALLPSYLERTNASLVYMAQALMNAAGHKESGFYLDQWQSLYDIIHRLEATGRKSILLGVTFALMDFATQFPMELKHTLVMETGGMKGRRKELTRAEVHHFLGNQWQLNAIHSEYGMTELLSQAYSAGNGLFRPSETLRVLVRDPYDPLSTSESGTGVINIIDLANQDSCAFVATEDLGTVFDDGSFTVSGRLDHSALRGCNLMVQ